MAVAWCFANSVEKFLKVNKKQFKHTHLKALQQPQLSEEENPRKCERKMTSTILENDLHGLKMVYK